jgi:energy-coupling factor transporter ATP-binding protein EcfA2
MDGQTILIYGPPMTGKSTFVKKVNGIEINDSFESGSSPESFPKIYVYNEKPDNTEQFNLVLQFTQKDVIFEKGLFT